MIQVILKGDSLRFSRAFGSNHSQASLDFIDVDPEEDIPLFFDPYVFEDKTDPFFVRCHRSIGSFFEQVLTCVRAGEHAKGRELLSHLREPNELCLGLSKGRPSGRGIGLGQAEKMYASLADSQAAKTGLLSDLAECELFVEGIGPDKISDITANIIRHHLIDYTQKQCALHAFPLTGDIPAGPIWDERSLRWTAIYADLPVVDGTPVILVPKKAVRWLGDLSHQHKRFYRHFVLNFLRDYFLKAGKRFVHILKDRSRRVYKTELEEAFPLSKDFLFRFSRDNPEVLSRYRSAFKQTKGVETSDLDDEFETSIFVDTLKERLAAIPPGNKNATTYHRLIVGILEFIFYPNLAYPEIEKEINEGRKRIDIMYSNSAKGGFFQRIAAQHHIPSLFIMVECKNYTSDPANPELDQLAGRFGVNSGRIGFLLARSFDDRERFLDRCRDTVQQGNGYILPLVDEDIVAMLDLIADGRRSLIDAKLEAILQRIVL